MPDTSGCPVFRRSPKPAARRAPEPSRPSRRMAAAVCLRASDDPERRQAATLGRVQSDVEPGGCAGVVACFGPLAIAQTFQQPPRDVPETAEQLHWGFAVCLRQSAEQAATFQQLHKDERNLQQVVIGLQFLRVGTVNVFQVQPAVLLAVEPLVLNLPPIATSL